MKQTTEQNLNLLRGNASHGSGYDSRGYHDINWILFQDIQNQSRQSRVKRSKDMDIDQGKLQF